MALNLSAARRHRENRLRHKFKSGLAMDQPNFAGDYDVLLDLVKSRASVRKLKPDPIPDDYVTRILEVGRWSMSGANGQPWDFIVVKDPDTKKALFRAYIEENNDFIYWMEQQHLLDGAAARFQAASSVLPDDP